MLFFDNSLAPEGTEKWVLKLAEYSSAITSWWRLNQELKVLKEPLFAEIHLLYRVKVGKY